MGTLSQKGTFEPARFVVVFWGVVTGGVAAVMLLVGEGKGDALAGLQHLTILVAAPFVLVMTGMCWALLRDLRQDPLIVRSELAEEAMEEAVIAGHEKYAGGFEIRIGPAQDEAPGEAKDGRDGKAPGSPPPGLLTGTPRHAPPRPGGPRAPAVARRGPTVGER